MGRLSFLGSLKIDEQKKFELGVDDEKLCRIFIFLLSCGTKAATLRKKRVIDLNSSFPSFLSSRQPLWLFLKATLMKTFLKEHEVHSAMILGNLTGRKRITTKAACSHPEKVF